MSCSPPSTPYTLYAKPKVTHVLSYLENLPLEVLHLLVFTLPILSPKDIVSLARTSKTLAFFLLSDDFARLSLLPAKTNSVIFCYRHMFLGAVVYLLRTSPVSVVSTFRQEVLFCSSGIFDKVLHSIASSISTSPPLTISSRLAFFASILDVFSDLWGVQESILYSIFHNASSSLSPFLVDFITEPRFVSVLNPYLTHRYSSPLCVMRSCFPSPTLFPLLFDAFRASVSAEEFSSALLATQLSEVEQDFNVLHVAIVAEDVEAVRILIDQVGMDVNAKDTRSDWEGEGETPLFVATANGNLEIAQALLAHPNIAVNVRNDDDEDGDEYFTTPLYAAVENGYLEIVHALLAHPNVNANLGTVRDGEQSTPLFVARNCEIVQALLAHPNTDPNAGFSDGEGYHTTPLYHAVEVGNLEIVQALLAHPNIDPNKAVCVYTHVQTALHLASRNARSDIILALLAHPDIETSILDDQGHSPFQVAASDAIRALLAPHPSHG